MQYRKQTSRRMLCSLNVWTHFPHSWKRLPMLWRLFLPISNAVSLTKLHLLELKILPGRLRG